MIENIKHKYEHRGIFVFVPSRLGQEQPRVMAAATSDENVRLLEEETDRARKLGIFGAPTFSVQGELFWGDDRLEDATTWAQRGTLSKRH